MQELKIAITATFTAEPIKDSISFWMDELNIPNEIEFAPYNQVFQQLLDPSSLILNNTRGLNLLLVRFEDWLRFKRSNSDAMQEVNDREIIEQNVEDLTLALKAATEKNAAPFILCICPGSPNLQNEQNLASFYLEMEDRLVDGLSAASNLCLLRPAEINTIYPVAEYYDSYGDKLGHVPFTPLFFATLGTAVTRKVFAIKSSPKKVIVLDCDQTLWKGICGEDGTWGIEIDAPRKVLQEFIIKQHQSGMVICLCSKNNRQDVINVFRNRTDMPLKWEHIVSHRINWNPKSENLKSLADELNLGLDSFIFIDDDPVVCAEVEANCPEVLTLRLPEEAWQIPTFLNHVWSFDHVKITEEDKKRASLYKQNAQRETVRKQSLSFENFLESLGLTIDISEMGAQDIARVAQLTQRTNQFNLTTIRRSESDIKTLCDSGKKRCLVVKVTDRFGDYGLVGIMIVEVGTEAITIDTFLLSCRVLGRGVEHRMLAKLGEIAQDQGCQLVKALYIASEKNQPAFEFLTKVGIGFQELLDNGMLFNFSAEEAARISSVAMLETSAEPSPSLKVTVQPVQPVDLIWQDRSKLLVRIANELTEAQQILNCIQDCKQKAIISGRREFLESQDEIERKLIGVWEEVLSVRPISTLDNFFELGGDSLAAVHMFSAIESEFARGFSLATLFQAPTVQALANLLRQEEKASAWTSLVPIQSQGSRTPFFCVHAGGGNVLFYKDLANRLGPNQPFYGLQAQGIRGKQPRHTTVEEMASHYIKEMRSVQPQGPYFFGGACFGGLVTFEMAQQLHAQGQEVGLAAMFDTSAPGYPVPLPSTRLLHLQKFYSWVRRIQHHIVSIYKLPNEKRSQYLFAKADKARRLFQRSIRNQKNRAANLTKDMISQNQPQALQKTQNTILAAQAAYRPKAYPGRITLFRASQQPFGIYFDFKMGWAGLATEGVDVIEVPGSHGAIVMEPHVGILADYLRKKLSVTKEDLKTSDTVKAYAVEPQGS